MKGSENEFPSLLLKEGSAPANPSAGDQKLFIDSSDHVLKRVDSTGTVTTVGATPTIVSAVLTSGDVTLTQNSYTDILSVSLAAGTWIIWGQTNLFSTSGSQDVNVRLYDSTNSTILSSGSMSMAGTNYDETITLVAPYSPAGSVTVKLQGTGSGTGGSKALRAIQSNQAGYTATQIVAIKIA